MALNFPVNCNSPRERTEWLYRAQEKLRLIHNFFGKWYKEGKTVDQYNNLPQKIRNRYPYKAQLTYNEFQTFIENDYDPRSRKVIGKLLEYRRNLKDSVEWSVDVEDME